MAMTAADFRAKFDDDAGWFVGDYRRQEMQIESRNSPKIDEARAMLIGGQSW